MMNFSEILSFLKEGRKYSFVIAAAGSLVVAMSYFGLWPVTLLLDGLIGLIFIGAAMGWFALLYEIGEASWRNLSGRWSGHREKRDLEKFLRSAPDRLELMTTSEARSLSWMFVNDRDQIEGMPASSGLERLIELGILVPTADAFVKQIIRVNPHVWEEREARLKKMPTDLKRQMRNAAPPWLKNERI